MAELRFCLSQDADPDAVLDRLAQADAAQEFSCSMSEGRLTVSSDVDADAESVRAFVRRAVGDMIDC